MTKIFISYRRDDSQYQADKLNKAMEPYVADPERDIFIDVDNIPPGADFVDHIDSRVAQCEVMLALIGKSWLGFDKASGKRRIDDPEDFVRIEIASALMRDIPVVPVLLDGMQVPTADQLPDDLKTLVRRNGVPLQRLSFDNDVDRLMTGLGLQKRNIQAAVPTAAYAEPRTPEQRKKRGVWVWYVLGLAAVIAMGAALYLTTMRGGDAAPVIEKKIAQTPETPDPIKTPDPVVLPANCVGNTDLGMSWGKMTTDKTSGAIRVGCNDNCDAVKGDTPCTTQLPLLCFTHTGSGKPASVPQSSTRYHQWAEGLVKSTKPIAACRFSTLADADALCAERFGAKWKAATYHDGVGHSFWALGDVADAPQRYWVHIRDKQDGTCWTNP